MAFPARTGSDEARSQIDKLVTAINDSAKQARVTEITLLALSADVIGVVLTTTDEVLVQPFTMLVT